MKKREPAPLTDRLPPSDAGAEEAIIGAILVSNGRCVPECQTALSPEHFYDLRWRLAFEKALALCESQKVVDSISLLQALRDSGELEKAGGETLVAKAVEACHSPANLPVWIESLVSKFRARRAIQIGTELVSSVYDDPSEADPAIASADESLMQLIAGNRNQSARHSDEIVLATLAEIEKRHQAGGKLTGLPTGFRDLDELTNGLQLGQQIILGARPMVGKSALCGNIIEHACLDQKIPTLMISLEMSLEQFMSRMSASFSRIEAERVKKGTLTEDDFKKITRFFSVVKASPLHFIDCVVKRLTSSEISAAIRIHAETHGVKLVVIDYLQIVRPAKSKQKRTDEVGEISSTLRRAAVATGTCVLAVAQLNRDSDKDKPRSPRLTDLRESGQIEQDADCVLLLHRSGNNGEASVHVAKQRDGATDLIPLHWQAEYCRFNDAAKIAEDDVPPDYRPTSPDP